MKQKKGKKTYSLRRRILIFFLVTYAIFTLLFVALGMMIYRLLYRQSEQTYRDVAENIGRQLDTDLNSAQNFVLTTLINNTELAELESSSDESVISLSRSRFMNYLRNYSPSFTRVDGFFFYVPASDSYMSAMNKTTTVPSYMRTYVRANDWDDTARVSKYVIHRIEEDYYLIKALSFRQRIGGPWVSLSSISANYAIPELANRSVILFADAETGEYYTSDTAFGAYRYDPSVTVCTAEYSGRSADYLQTIIETQYCRDKLVLLVPIELLQRGLRTFYAATGLIFLALLTGFLLMYLLVRRNLTEPVNELRRISQQLRESQDSGFIPEGPILRTDSKSIEVQTINEELENLIDQISELRNRVLSEELAKNQYELQSLKNQVSPHFLINCLSTLSSLSNLSDNQKLVKTLIALLASHLRYTLSTKSAVSISEETLHLRDYYEMMKIRYPNSLTYEIDVMDLCDDAAIFPSLILMLSENSVKHNLTVGEELFIRVDIREEQVKGARMVHITHTDSGDGFQENMLDRLNSLGDASPEEIAEGQNIGLYNIVKRLQLAYRGGYSSIEFSNQPEGGARIDIIIPYRSYQES